VRSYLNELRKISIKRLALFRSEPLYTDGNGTDIRIWDRVIDPSDVRVLSINEEVKMVPEPHVDRYKFWETVGLADIKPFIQIKGGSLPDSTNAINLT